MDIVATTTAGKVAGVQHDGVLQFRGIPFAAPPTGPRRYRPPQPAEPWDGVRDCREYGPMAVQAKGGLEQLLGGRQQDASEDCLTLNVFTPAADDGSRPVMVWIHGGAFVTGSGAVPWYSGARLATKGDVVVVTFNYRLGALGFLDLASVLGEEYRSSGNLGLLDQIAALEWVRDNIAGFGGDPADVTVFGESAGGMSVSTLLAMPAARGLFGKAIAQSGAANHTRTPDAAGVITRLFLGELGIDEASADELLDLPVERIRAAQDALGAALLLSGAVGELGTMLPFVPLVNGADLPGPPLELIEAGNAAAVPVLTGTTAEEWNLFHLLGGAHGTLDDERLGQRCERLFAPVHGAGAGRRALEVYRRNRPGASLDQLWSAIETDRVFRIPTIRLAEAHAGRGNPTFMYLFTWATPAFGGMLGSCHAIDIPFVFDNLHSPGVSLLLAGSGEEEQRLATVASDAWLAFARHGSPAHDGLPSWPAYDTASRSTMALGAACEIVDDPAGDERRLWDGVAL